MSQRLLARYIGRSVLMAVLGVLLALVGLDMVFAFLAELEDLGPGYGWLEALRYVGLTAPRRIHDMLPVATLIGGIVGLGQLANHSELTVMRASGVPTRRIVGWALRPALLLIALGLVLGQYVVPAAEREAAASQSLAKGRSLESKLSGYWHREGNQLIHIQAARAGDSLQGVTFYTLDDQRRLVEAMAAEQAVYQQGRWRLLGVSSSQWLPAGVQASRAVTVPWKTALTPEFLRLVTLEPEHLSLTSLYEYAGYLARQGLRSDVYFLEFWKKLLAPLAVVSMVLIACSFVFGPLRSVPMGQRIMAGVMTGLLFRYGQDFSGYASLVFQFSPLMAALVPVLLCLGLGGYALSRAK